MLLVVRNQVAQREPVVGRDEVDAGRGAARVALVEVGATGEPRGQLAEDGEGTSPHVPDRVAVAPVPSDHWGGSCRPGSHLAQVPGLGDELDLADHRSCCTRSKNADSRSTSWNWRASVAARSKRETVDVHLDDPVAQAVHDQLQRVWVGHVEAVAGAGGVVVVGPVVGHEPVVGGVVDALERQDRAQVVALGRVVVDDVEDHLDAGLVERPHHRLELGDLGAVAAGAGILVVGARNPMEL